MPSFVRTLSVILFGLASPLANAEEVAGKYQATGTAPGGGRYTGNVTITKRAETYRVQWQLGPAGDYTGIGILVQNLFATAYGGGRPYGMVIYQIDSGKLSGVWGVEGSDKLGIEILEGPSSLSGSYAITSGVTPTGQTYSGKVTLMPTGETFAIHWTLPEASYSGVALRVGDYLVAAYGEGQGYGVAAYIVRDKELDGRWAAAGAEKLGTETLKR